MKQPLSPIAVVQLKPVIAASAMSLLTALSAASMSGAATITAASASHCSCVRSLNSGSLPLTRQTCSYWPLISARYERRHDSGCRPGSRCQIQRTSTARGCDAARSQREHPHKANRRGQEDRADAAITTFEKPTITRSDRSSQSQPNRRARASSSRRGSLPVSRTWRTP